MPNYYIRHRGYKCFISRGDGGSLFKKDATWIPRVGLADAHGVSFESANYPGHYIRHQYNRLRIDKDDGSQLFRNDATFYLKYKN